MGGGEHVPGVYNAPVKGHVNYLLSPYRQRYFVGFFSKAPKRILAKFRNNWAWVPGIVGGYSLYVWANWKEDQIKRSHRL